MCTASYSYLFKILVTGFLYKRLSGPYGEFQPIPKICTIHLIILSMGMVCFHPLAHRCFPKTRSLLLTGLLNMGSRSSHHQSLQRPQEEQKSPTKGGDGVSTMKKFYCSFGLTILKKLKAKIAAKPERKCARRCMRDKA